MRLTCTVHRTESGLTRLQSAPSTGVSRDDERSECLVRSVSAHKAARKIESTDPRVSGGYGRRRRPRAAAGHKPGRLVTPPLSCLIETARFEVSNLPTTRHLAHIAGLASACAPAKGTILNNVRQTLRMAALTAVLASAPLSLSNAIASADFERVTPNAPVELAGFVPAPVAPPADDAPATPDAPPAPEAPNAAPVADAAPAPADLPPAPDAPPAPAPDAPPAPALRHLRPHLRHLRPHRKPRRPPMTLRRQRKRRRPRRPTASTGTRSLAASPVATGRSAPATATPAVCSSRRAPGVPTVARAPRTVRAVRSRSGWPRMCCTRRASARGRSAAVAAEPTNH